jgi:hypothetical protein
MVQVIKIFGILIIAAALLGAIALFIQNANVGIVSYTQTETHSKSDQATSSITTLINSTSTEFEDIALPNAKDVIPDAVFIKSLVSPDGTRRGDVYVSYVAGTTSAFSTLYVLDKDNGNDKIVYAIVSNNFVNTAGNDHEIGQKDLFGYRLGEMRDDSFSVYPQYRSGKYEAEGLLVRWYKDDSVFAVAPHSISEMGAKFVKSFKTPAGAEIAKMYEQLDGSGKITNFDFIKKDGAREKEIFAIDLTGFYDSSSSNPKMVKEIDMQSLDPDSYKVVTIRSDYVVIRPIPQNGQPTIGDVTVKWDYDAQSFHTQR